MGRIRSLGWYDRSPINHIDLQVDHSTDIGFHAMPAIMLTIDLLFLSPPWTITALPSVGVSSVLAFGYWFWVEQCYKHNGWSVLG